MSERSLRILYIDDDPDMARLVQGMLKRRGHAVEHAAAAEAGLARLGAGGFDAVALDHYLETGTGLDVLKAMQKLADAPPVVYVTGSAEAAVAVAALKAGAFDYVTKSIEPEFFELLASAVEQAAERARLLRAKAQVESELRQAKERAELLLQEVNHRVANSLAMVSALVNLQANAVAAPEAKAALAATQSRIAAIAGLHRRLYSAEDVRFIDIGAYLEGLVQELEASIAAGDGLVRAVAKLETALVPVDKAVSLGVVTAELLTNALKYAYPDGGRGEVRVTLAVPAPGELMLSVEDDGRGWKGTGPPAGTGLGTRLIQAMASNLGTTVDYEQKSPGMRASLRVLLQPTTKS